MKNSTHSPKLASQAKSNGEKERDNDNRRPEGSAGTHHDSTAQKTAREQGTHPVKTDE